MSEQSSTTTEGAGLVRARRAVAAAPTGVFGGTRAGRGHSAADERRHSRRTVHWRDLLIRPLEDQPRRSRNAAQAPDVSHRIQRFVAELTDRPLRYLVSMTYHGDHTFGNLASPPRR
jgi:hypothetical protein